MKTKRAFYPWALIPLALIVVACEPAGTQKETDESAVFFQQPVTTEGWTVTGQGAQPNRFNGVNLAAVPVAKNSSEVNPQLISNEQTMTRNLPALNGMTIGTAGLTFSVEQKSDSGFRFDVTFATGVGMPVQARVTATGVTAKCGFLDKNDAGATQSFSFDGGALREKTDHQIRIVRHSSALASIVFNQKVIFPNIACDPEPITDKEPRSGGYLKVSVLAVQPPTQAHWTSAMFDRNIVKVLFKRAAVWPDAITGVEQ